MKATTKKAPAKKEAKEATMVEASVGKGLETACDGNILHIKIDLTSVEYTTEKGNFMHGTSAGNIPIPGAPKLFRLSLSAYSFPEDKEAKKK